MGPSEGIDLYEIKPVKFELPNDFIPVFKIELNLIRF